MIRTYPDTSILIAAARGDQDVSNDAFKVLFDPEREYLSSLLVVTETLAPTIHHGYSDQAAFYEYYFANAISEWAILTDEVACVAYAEVTENGLEPYDAFHVSAAASLRADELLTSEKHGRGMTRASSVKVIDIRPSS